MAEGLTYIKSHAQIVPTSLFAASRDGAVVARRAHNPKVGGSNPSPATNTNSPKAEAPGESPCVRRREARPSAENTGVEYPGGQSEVDPPVPIPNTEVKRLSADDTAWATGCGK
jgi:hypothetical protein